jgi:hypothetical protein
MRCRETEAKTLQICFAFAAILPPPHIRLLIGDC